MEVERGQLLCVSLGPPESESGAEQLVAAGSSNDRLRLWTVADGTLVGETRAHRRGITCVAFAPDGSRLASGGPDRTLRIWSVPQLEPLAVLRGPERPVHLVAWSPDGRRVVAASLGGEFAVWDAGSGELLHSRAGPAQRGVSALAITRDGTRVAWAGDGGNLRLWDSATGRKVAGLRVDGLGLVTALAVSDDGRFLATATRDVRQLSVWDLQSGELTARCGPLRGEARSLALDPAGRRLLSSSGDGVLQLWDARTGVELGVSDFGAGGFTDLRQAGEPRQLAETTEPSQTSEPSQTTEPSPLGEPGAARAVSFDSGGALAAAAGPAGRLTLWPVGLAADLPLLERGALLSAAVMRLSEDGSDAAFPPDGRVPLARLAIPDYDPPELRPPGQGALSVEDFPARARVLNGRTITARGFPIAARVEDGRVRSFLLSRFPPGCCFGALPFPDEWIAITLTEPAAPMAADVPVEVTGTLAVGELLDEQGFVTSLYRMQAERVDPIR
ncbi:MAG: hypothetical protein V3T22_08020 [Planctomycetota bacterium]